MAASPVENDQLELKPIQKYATMDNVPKEKGSSTMKLDPSEKLLTASCSEAEDSDQFEEEEERMWVTLFPWLLKWSWFRNRRYKRKNGKSRLQWDNRAQYILTLVGYAVGLGNLWRFSYLVAKHGGATFVIPYFIMLFVVGIPLFYMESTLGQSLQRGPVKVWYKICPNLWGIGLAGVVTTMIIRVYYNVILGWVLLYFFQSFQHPLPWSECGGYHVKLDYGKNEEFLMSKVNDSSYHDLQSCINDSTRYFWYVNALQSSPDINHLGGFSWKLLLTFLFSWVTVYVCIFRGIKSSGKAVYFTATFPYLVMIIIFFRAVTLEGAGIGLKFLFIPESESFLKTFFKPQVWLEAATQIFFSLGLSLGTIVALSSYSKQTNNSFVDTLVVCFTNSFTSIFASIIVFSIVGFKAAQLGTHPKLVSQGPGMTFIVITEALTLLPVPQLWSILFFIMVFLLGLDSHFGGLEVLITVLYDIKKVRKYRREVVIGIICIVMFLLNFPFALGNGFYLFQVFDQFAGTLPLLFLGCCEVITISYVYGVNRFFDLVKYPVHPMLKFFWWIVWTFVSPVAMVTILFGSIIHELVEPLRYTVFRVTGQKGFKTEERVPFSDWAQFIGAMLILGSVCCVPGVFIYRMIRYRKARKQTAKFWILTKVRASWIYQQVKAFVLTNREDSNDEEQSLYEGEGEESEISDGQQDQSELSD